MSVYKDYKAPEGGGGLYLKFEDGKAIKLRLMSEPFLFTAQFSEDSPIQTKYAWTIWNYDENKAQILQLPITGFRQIQELAADDEWGDPQGYNLTVKRTGSGLETKYSVIPGLKATVTQEMLDAAKGVDVKEKVKGSIPLSQIVTGTPVPAPVKNEEPPVETRAPQGDEVDLDSIPF